MNTTLSITFNTHLMCKDSKRMLRQQNPSKQNEITPPKEMWHVCNVKKRSYRLANSQILTSEIVWPPIRTDHKVHNKLFLVSSHYSHQHLHA